MYCPQCRAEFRPGYSTCNRCEVALVEVLEVDPFATPEAMAEMLAERDVAPAFGGTLGALRELQSSLSARRIPSMIGPSNEPPRPGHPPRMLLLLALEDAERALAHFEGEFRSELNTEILQPLVGRPSQADEADEEEGSGCPACGSEGGLDEEGCCAECGLFLG